MKKIIIRSKSGEIYYAIFNLKHIREVKESIEEKMYKTSFIEYLSREGRKAMLNIDSIESFKCD